MSDLVFRHSHLEHKLFEIFTVFVPVLGSGVQLCVHPGLSSSMTAGSLTPCLGEDASIDQFPIPNKAIQNGLQ